jgi:hypothetical protein
MYSVGRDDEGKSLYLIQDLIANAHRISQLDPDFVLVHIASNEIANMRGDWPVAVWNSQIRILVDNCKLFASRFPRGITICFLEVVPRLKCSGPLMTPSKFEQYAQAFNNQMAAVSKRAIRGALDVHSGFRYAKARGWRFEHIPGRGNCIPRPLGCMLSGDNIHPTLSTFRSEYSRCIQRAIKEHNNRPARLLRL